MSCSLHDAARFEALGLPTVVIATDAFTRSTRDQLDALNFADFHPYVVFAPHPLASLDEPAVHAKADLIRETVITALTRP